jgi:WD40 repeat protein
MLELANGGERVAVVYPHEGGGTVRIFDRAGWVQAVVLDSLFARAEHSVQLSPDGKQLVAWTASGESKYWNLESPEKKAVGVTPAAPR